MSRWWRAYDEAVDDPKLIGLTDEQHRFWFNILCVCSAFAGRLPDVRTLSIKLRMQPRRVIRLTNDLRKAGLLDEADGVTSPHNWDTRQYKSDSSTGRTRAYRERHRNVTVTGGGNVTVTPPETENRDREEDTACAVSKYAFESGVIRLVEKDLAQWKRDFSYLDVPAELLSLTEFAQKNSAKWFFAVQGALGKRNRDVKAKRDAAPKAANGGFV